jgi:hypothetical protein
MAILTIASTARSADPPLNGAEQKVLDKEVGKWRNSYKCLRAEWTPQETTGTDEVTAIRVLGGRFVQEISEHSDKTSSMRILTYDSQKKCYRGWWFSSGGQTTEHTGKWDNESKTMTWSSVGEPAFQTTVSNRFLDDNHSTWDVTVKNPAGKTLFRMEGKSARAKETKR